MRLSPSLVLLSLLPCVCLFPAPPPARAQAERFDLVISGGRVLNPESRLDAVRNVGIKAGKVAAISAEPLRGKEVVDATGLVVCPGFIDLHSHAQTLAGMRMQAFDGVTTSLELENGMLPVGLAYAAAAREGRPLNYGFSSSWAIARMIALAGLKSDGRLSTIRGKTGRLKWKHFVKPGESRKVLDLVEQGLREGSVGVGVALGYGPESNADEYFEIARMAKKYGVPVFTHIRYLEPYGPKNSLMAHQELIALAAMTGAHMHVCHLNSTASKRIPEMLDAVASANARGLKVTFEGYPYGAGSTSIGAAFLTPENLANIGIKPSDIVYLRTGKPLASAEELARLRRKNPDGMVLVKFLDEANPRDRRLIDRVICHPQAAVASDAVPWEVGGKLLVDDVWPLPAGAVAHPRAAGCFTRILGRYVRAEKKLSLMEAVRRCSLRPAQILQESVPQMKNKGRLRVGADADLIVFDPKTVIDRATYRHPNRTPVGMRFVLVNGVPLIRDGRLVRDAFPGKAVRRVVKN
jgi:dihydroorotase-like cyclic amidohydrolase